MKRIKLTVIKGKSVGLGICALSLVASLNAQPVDTWETVDDILTGPPNGVGLEVGVDRSNTVFTVGIGGSYPGTNLPAIINWSKAPGDIWDTNLVTVLGGQSAAFGSFASDPVNNVLYVGGMVTDSSGVHWVVCQSTNSGTNWFVSDISHSPGDGANCIDLAVDNRGNAYGIGLGHDSRGNSVWITRRLLVGTTNWTTVDVPATGTKSIVISGRAIAFSTNGIFAAGSSLSKSSEAWTVRRSTDGGRSWVNVDSLPARSRANDVAVDSRGNIYVSGFNDTYGWALRCSTNGGLNWSYVDTIIPNSTAWGLTTVRRTDNLPDDVYACGFQVLSGSGSHWIVRKLSGGVGPSVLSDDYAPTANGSQAFAIAADSLGHVFATGTFRDADNNVHWITRRLTIP
jgi:hypothetical protein